MKQPCSRYDKFTYTKFLTDPYAKLGVLIQHELFHLYHEREIENVLTTFKDGPKTLPSTPPG
jgi:hypothetical protein